MKLKGNSATQLVSGVQPRGFCVDKSSLGPKPEGATEAQLSLLDLAEQPVEPL